MHETKITLRAVQLLHQPGGSVYGRLRSGVFRNRNQNTIDAHRAVLSRHKASAVRGNEQGHLPGGSSNRLRYRFAEPANATIVIAGCQHDEINLLMLQKAEHRLHRVIAICNYLLYAKTELCDRRSWAARFQQSPTFQGLAHCRKVSHVRLAVWRNV